MSNHHYVVTTLIQSTLPDTETGALPEPVEVQWYGGANLATALAALASAAVEHENVTEHPALYRTLAVALRIEEVQETVVEDPTDPDPYGTEPVQVDQSLGAFTVSEEEAERERSIMQSDEG